MLDTGLNLAILLLSLFHLAQDVIIPFGESLSQGGSQEHENERPHDVEVQN